jgi:hypothetical protein
LRGKTAPHETAQDQRDKLIDMTEHHVLRRDGRLGAITHAARPDHDPATEEETTFDPTRMIALPGQALSHQAAARGIPLTGDLPDGPRIPRGRGTRDAVTLVTCAICLCDRGSANRRHARPHGGPAISRQIALARGGTIRAGMILPSGSAPQTEPMGARRVA